MSQRVLVTAGATGIGREFVRAFAANGARVYVCDIDSNALDALAREVKGLVTGHCDNAKRSDIEAMVPAAAQALGGLDVLINNAGVAGPTVPVEQWDPGEWDKVININLTGTFDVTRVAIPYLKKSPAASIIIMSSAAGRFGFPNRSAYAASKWGLIGLTKTLSRELGEFNIRVNAILPGPVAGDRIERVIAARANLAGRSFEEERALSMSLLSLQRFVDPKDIAALGVFLASDAGKCISGQMLPIDNDAQGC
jgi:NAD(P)-dependent dehydrogenase (short-subunit alcohol dehydrogenase family)